MRAALFLAAVVALAVAAPLELHLHLNAVAAPPRPQISEDFLAETEIEVHNGSHATVFGEGYYAVDTRGNKMAERFDFNPAPYHVRHVFDLLRYDLGKEYQLNSEDRNDCRVRNLTGHLEGPFDWVANATYNGTIRHHEVELDVWVASIAGVRLALGVDQHDPNRPLVLERESSHEFVRYYFREFHATVPDSQYFEVPHECPQAKALKADPPRPNIANTFIAATDVEVHEDGPAIFGQGFFAADQNNNRAAERYDLQQGQYHVRHELLLQRYDLHKEYYLSSEDPNDCHSRAVNGTLPPAWAWVANATYAGQVKHHEVTLDAWELRFAGQRVAVGVRPDNTNVPVVYERESSHSLVRYFFREFNATMPDGKYFAVPSECSQ